MSLDAPLSDKAIVAKAAERGARVVGTTAAATAEAWRPAALGPKSPLHNVQSAKRAEDCEFPIQCDVIAWADDSATLREYPKLGERRIDPIDLADFARVYQRALEWWRRTPVAARTASGLGCALATPHLYVVIGTGRQMTVASA